MSISTESYKGRLFEHRVFVGGFNALPSTSNKKSLKGLVLKNGLFQCLGYVMSLLTGGFLGVKTLKSSSLKGRTVYILTTRSEFSKFAEKSMRLQKVKKVWFSTLEAKQ